MDKRIREAIDACRPGSDDLLASDMADVARALADDAQARQVQERVQGWDAAIGGSIDKVDVPPGLAERILARLAGDSAPAAASELLTGELLTGTVAAASQVEPLQTESSTGDVQVAPNRSPSDEASPVRAGWSRRHWLGAAGLGLTAAALVIAAGYWLRQSSDQPLELLAEQWQAELNGDWQAPDRAPGEFPLPEAIRVAPTRWQWIGRFAPSPVVAYELDHPKAGKAMLYVTRMTRAGLPGVPPLPPQWRSGGQAVGYWHSGDKVYVLVVPDERSYRAFVRPSAAPLA